MNMSSTPAARMPPPSFGAGGQPDWSHPPAGQPGAPHMPSKPLLKRPSQPLLSNDNKRLRDGADAPWNAGPAQAPFHGDRLRDGGFDGRDRRPPPPHAEGNGDRADRPWPPTYGGDYIPPASFGAAQPAAGCNDCEIIVIDKSITLYAEHVERRLKAAGLTVDVLFPRNISTINPIISEMESRGVMFAVTMDPNNEMQRTLTVNVLHCRPSQEHRNLPLEDAISLIERQFSSGDHALPDRRVIESRPVAAANKTSSQLLLAPPPPAIVTLMEFVRLNRLLSVAEYDQLIKYLEERREQQVQPATETAAHQPPAETASSAPALLPHPGAVSASADNNRTEYETGEAAAQDDSTTAPPTGQYGESRVKQPLLVAQPYSAPRMPIRPRKPGPGWPPHAPHQTGGAPMRPAGRMMPPRPDMHYGHQY